MKSYGYAMVVIEEVLYHFCTSLIFSGSDLNFHRYVWASENRGNTLTDVKSTPLIKIKQS